MQPKKGGEERIVERKVVYPGQFIFREGDTGDRAYLVQDGTIEIMKAARGGQQVLLGEIGPGGIFGEMALVDDQPRMASAMARKQSVLVIITRDQFRAKMADADPFVRALIKILTANVRAITKRMI